MTIDRLTNILVTILLIEMMTAIGLGVTICDLARVIRDWRLMIRAVLANYVCFPAATLGLLLLLKPANPAVAAGFLILAVCPGAPFGPPCTRLAGGDVATSVGLMASLAASSALAAPVLLHALLSLLPDSHTLQVDVGRIVGTLLVTQLLPLSLGLVLRHWRPGLAERLQTPANRISAVLSLTVVGLILYTQINLLAQIRLRGYAGMLALFVASLAAGWLFGRPGRENRKAMTLTTSLRNVGVALVIAAGSFANTPAVTAVLAYGILEIAGSALLAWIWGRQLAGAASRVPEIIELGDRPINVNNSPR